MVRTIPIILITQLIVTIRGIHIRTIQQIILHRMLVSHIQIMDIQTMAHQATGTQTIVHQTMATLTTVHVVTVGGI